MARLNRFQIMELYKEDIIASFRSHEKSVFTEENIQAILNEHRKQWRLPISTTTENLIMFLQQKKMMTYVSLEFPRRNFTRYLFDKSPEDISVMELACSLFKNAYISHYTAAFYHNLTDNIVKSVFVNNEQRPKDIQIKELNQVDIDNAFSKDMRTTNNIASYMGRSIYILNSKYTNNLGVIEGNGVKVTNIERTLIDIAVRPNYCGSVFEVINIYKNAQGEASVNKLYSLLKKMDFLYPYHQVIGFYLERAGFKENVLKLMERFPIKHNFYLTYNMKKTNFSDRWKLFYPAELD